MITSIFLFLFTSFAHGEIAELQIIASMDRAAYRPGESVSVSIRIINAGRTSTRIAAPGYANITINVAGHWLRLTEGEAAPEIELAPGQSTEAFHYPLISNQVNELILPQGEYVLIVTYDDRDSAVIPVTLYNQSGSDEKKYEEWKKWRFADRENRFDLARSYVSDHKEDTDPISYHMLICYLNDAILNNREADKQYQSEIIDHGIRIYGLKGRLAVFKAHHQRKAGDTPGAIETIIGVDNAIAIDWLEEYVSTINIRMGHLLPAIVRLTEEIERRELSKELVDRVVAVRAYAYYNVGNIQKAIEVIQPIIPSEAEKWSHERK